jgi:hypothetical protein
MYANMLLTKLPSSIKLLERKTIPNSRANRILARVCEECHPSAFKNAVKLNLLLASELSFSLS